MCGASKLNNTFSALFVTPKLKGGQSLWCPQFFRRTPFTDEGGRFYGYHGIYTFVLIQGTSM